MSKKISDEQFFELCKQTCGTDATWFAFRVFRSVLKEQGVLKPGERLSESQVALFADMTILRKEKNLQWKEAAEEALTKDSAETESSSLMKALLLIHNFDDSKSGDYDAMLHSQFCDIAKKYDFNLDEYTKLETQLTDLVEVLPIKNEAKIKIRELRKFIYEQCFEYEYMND